MGTGDFNGENDPSAPGWCSDVYGILPHPADARVWLVSAEGSWSLPHVRVDELIYPDNLGRVTELMRQALGLDVVAYRYADYLYDEEGHTIAGVYALEYRGLMVQEPVGGKWIDCPGLALLPIVPEEHRSAIDAYLNEVENGNIPSERPPWAYRGWFEQAQTWIVKQLEMLGYTSAAPVEQVRGWGLSCVLQAPTTTTAIYFKTAANLALFADEPVVMEQLSNWYPDHIPRPLCVDRTRHWMLLVDWGPSIGWEASVETREAMYRTFARLQVDSSARGDELLAMGCVDRRLHVLKAQIDPLLEDGRALALLENSERDQLRALAPRLKAMCDELASYKLPYALVHGDLHPGNVAVRDGKMLFFDWTDASLAHPLFDLMHLFYDEPAVQTRLRDSYFEAWTAFEPIERLRAAWTLAAPLCALHHTVSYQYIVAGLEALTRLEVASGLSFFGRKVLDMIKR